MPGKAATPEQTADVIAYREAGFTVATIAARSGLSGSTVSRIVAANASKKGAATAEVLDAARRELRLLLTSKEGIADEAALMIADDLAQARMLRDRVVLAAEHLIANNLEEAALLMRAAAAMSTALKNTSEMVRRSLGYDKQRDELDEEDLPVLQVLELTREQVEELTQERNAANDDDILEGDTIVKQSCKGALP